MLPDHIKNAIDTYIPALEGWTEVDRACEMAELIIDHKPQSVVEIGTFGGRSAIAQGFALRENNNGGKIYCIDPWRLDYALEGESQENRDWWSCNIDIEKIHAGCMSAIRSHRLDEWVVVIRAASQFAYGLFSNIGVLLIDGNHSEVASSRDAELYLPRVAPGGFVWMDDTDWIIKDGDNLINTTKKAVQIIESQCKLVRDMGKHRLYQKNV